MAHFTKAHILTLCLLLLMVSSDARLISNGFSDVPKQINSEIILRNLGYSVPKSGNVPRRMMQGVETDKTAPGGPDPQHH
ncbi:hypothetical protein ACJRO7_023229 [Eucalyptus globulus]|uniref:CLAVATA3/ESR (CLE)-related protein n=1 Tax=Eucalyptus globulus TaxID=34317 RepID=A0ABD3K631_EUCGL